MKPLVIYHGGCRDGFCAAWVVSLAMPYAEFMPAQYGHAPPDVSGREVVIVDFSYPRSEMEEMIASASSLLVLDHHKTAEEALRGLPGVMFDMSRSGAGIAWDFFFGPGGRPPIVDYIEDRDLWRFKLPHSEAVNAWLGVIPFTFADWQRESETEVESWISKGRAVEAKVRNYVAEVRKSARRITFEGYDVPIVNAAQVDISELVGAMAESETFAMGWWQRSDGLFSYSLRSRGDFDVSALAKKYGGGGHKNAAGFTRSVLL